MAITILSDGQVFLPPDIRVAAHLREGDRLEVELTAHGILLRPASGTDTDQDWFWTPAWQAREREADADLAAGRTTLYQGDAEFLAALEAARRSDTDV